MKNNSLKSNQRKLHCLLASILVLCLGSSLFSHPVTPAPPALTDEELYLRAFNAENNRAYLDAAVNLYAYIQRDPEAMSDADFSNKVKAAYNSYVEILKGIQEERDRLRKDLDNLLRQAGQPAKQTKGVEVPNALPTPVKKSISNQVKRMQCEIYARSALMLGEISTKNNCGYAGNRWSADYGLHFNWCMESTDNSTENESAIRQKLLAKCANRPGRLYVRPNE